MWKNGEYQCKLYLDCLVFLTPALLRTENINTNRQKSKLFIFKQEHYRFSWYSIVENEEISINKYITTMIVNIFSDNHNNKGEQYSPPGLRKSLFSYENVWRGNKLNKNKQSNCVEIIQIRLHRFNFCISFGELPKFVPVVQNIIF